MKRKTSFANKIYSIQKRKKKKSRGIKINSGESFRISAYPETQRNGVLTSFNAMFFENV